jgi:hypothetical protein
MKTHVVLTVVALAAAASACAQQATPAQAEKGAWDSIVCPNVQLNSGTRAPGEDAGAMMARCVSRGYHTGAGDDRFVGVPRWIAFFRHHL